MAAALPTRKAGGDAHATPSKASSSFSPTSSPSSLSPSSSSSRLSLTSSASSSSSDRQVFLTPGSAAADDKQAEPAVVKRKKASNSPCSISFEDLSARFHMPINECAKDLGVCTTVLKKVCRRYGIPRWPHRKLVALEKMIEKRKKEETRSSGDAGPELTEFQILELKKQTILHNPSTLIRFDAVGQTSGRATSTRSARAQGPGEISKVSYFFSRGSRDAPAAIAAPSSSSSSSSSSLSAQQPGLDALKAASTLQQLEMLAASTLHLLGRSVVAPDCQPAEPLSAKRSRTCEPTSSYQHEKRHRGQSY